MSRRLFVPILSHLNLLVAFRFFPFSLCFVASCPVPVRFGVCLMLIRCLFDAYPMTSAISYLPASFPARNFAAASAPFAKIALE